jgi:SAM-dependent methyltransferase
MADASSVWYTRTFEKFMVHIDQASVFVGELGRFISRHRPGSILDIGAGNGTLAVPLSRQVEEYVAVERNPVYATRLRSCGIEVIEGSFPLPLAGTYDLVVMSHVISYEESVHYEMVSASWELVAPGGHLLVVAHRGGASSDWGRLLTGIGMDEFVRYPESIFDEILSTLRTMGAVEVREVITTVVTTNLRDMLEMLAFVAPSGHYQEFIDHGAELVPLLDREYRAGAGYAFPFKNSFVYVRDVRGQAGRV